MINSTKNICAAAVKKGATLDSKLSGLNPVKEIFTVEDYTNWIATLIAQVTAPRDATKDATRTTQYKIELAGLLNQQKDPKAAFEAQKIKLVKYAEEIKRLAKDTDVKSIASIWQALALDNSEPAESILRQLSGKNGPKANASAFFLGQISEGCFDFGQALKFYRKAYLNGPKNRSSLEANAHMAFL